MNLIISMFSADLFIFFLVSSLDKISPHRKVLQIHLLVDSLFHCPSANSMYTVMSSPSVFTFLFFGTFSIYKPYLCLYSIWFVSWKGRRQTWMKQIYYSTTLNKEAAGSSDTLEPICKITYLRKPQINAHHHENLKSHTRKKVQLLHH